MSYNKKSVDQNLEDIDDNFTATNVEAALAELKSSTAITFDPERLPTIYISDSTVDVQTALEELDARTGISSDTTNIDIEGGGSVDINLTALGGATLLVSTSNVDIEAIDEEVYIFGNKGIQLDSGTGGPSNNGIIINAQDGPIQLTGADVEVGSTLIPYKLLASGGIGIGNAVVATNGVVVNQAEIFDETGVSIGFIPIYDTGVLIIDGGGP